MIEIKQCPSVATLFEDSGIAATIGRRKFDNIARVENRPRLGIGLDKGIGNALDKFGIARAISIGRRQINLKLLAFFASDERLFHAGRPLPIA